MVSLAQSLDPSPTTQKDDGDIEIKRNVFFFFSLSPQMATMEVAEEYLLHRHSWDELCVIFLATHDVSSSSVLYRCSSII